MYSSITPSCSGYLQQKGKKMSGFVKYGELNKNDIVIFHGAQVVIKETRVNGICDNNYHKGEKIISFDIEPYDDEALKILGNFYAYGTYGGVESRSIWKI